MSLGKDSPMPYSINVPAWDGDPRSVMDVWRVRKGRRVAVCTLWTHPKGGEMRLTVDSEWVRGEGRSDGLELIELSEEWRRQFTEKGWQA